MCPKLKRYCSKSCLGLANARKRFPVPVGRLFGRLTVIEGAGTSPDRRRLLLCRCSCGNVIVRKRANLVRGDVLS